MISVVIIAELMVEYTSALAKLTAGFLPRRRGDNNVVRIGGFTLPCPSPRRGDGDVVRIGGFSLRWPRRTSPVPDFSSHLVDF
ncbi:unnamed protein product [Cochlearia groenlandica]